jgi:transketolase
MTTIDLVKKMKILSLEMVHKVNASHIGGAFSIADVLAVLYNDILQYNIDNHKDDLRDRVFYSKGHSCSSLYAVLHLMDFFSREVLDTFGKNGSFLTTHVNHKVPGVELSTGSLGHGLSVATGVALAGKRKKADWKVYAILSDGELDEGSNWEAILFAPHHQLNNLVVIIDYNKIQSFGDVADVLNLHPLDQKFKAFGWDVKEIDGHNHSEISAALNKSNLHPQKPTVIIANTIKGNGVDFMEHQLAWHYKTPNKEQLNNAINQIQKPS